MRYAQLTNCVLIQPWSIQRSTKTNTLGINILHFFLWIGVSATYPYDRTMESLLFWMASIAVNHSSNWMFDTMDVRILILYNELFITWNKQKRRWYLLCLLLQNKPPKTWIISKLTLQNCHFCILFQSHRSLCGDLHPPLSYRTQKLSMQFLLKATVCCHSLVHLPVTILSTLVLCIHSLYPLAVAAAHIVLYTPA